MRRIGIALWIALFALVVVVGSTQAVIPFERYRAEVGQVRQAIGFQLSLVSATEVGSDARIKTLEDLLDIVDENIATLDRLGSEECYRWYAETILISLMLYRDIVQADIDGEKVPELVSASRATLSAAVAMDPIIERRCSRLISPVPPTEPAFIVPL